MMRTNYPAILALSVLLAACAAEQQAAEEVAAKSEHARSVVLSAKEKNILQLADASLRSNNLKEAARLYRQAMDMSQGAVDAHLALANVLVEREHNIPEALNVLSRARSVQPDNPEILRNLGNGLIDMGRTDEALEVYGDWVSRIPTDPRAYNAKGVALDMLDRHVEAQEAYRKGIAHAKGDVEYIENNLALSLLAMGNYDEAIPLLEKIYAASKDNETVRQNLALAYGLAGHSEKSAELLKGMSKQQIEENQKFYRYIRDQQSKPPAPVVEEKKEEQVKPPEVKQEAPLAPVKPPEVKKETPVPVVPKAEEVKPAPKKEPLLEPEPAPEEMPEELPAEAPVAEEAPMPEMPASAPAESINTLPTKRSVTPQEAAPETVRDEPAPEESGISDKITFEDKAASGAASEGEQNTPDDNKAVEDETPPVKLNLDSI